MTDRDKIIETVLDADITGIKIRNITGGISTANAIADALIAAGIGDISKWQLMSKVLHNQMIENSREEKHRAEVAEQKATVWKDCANKWQKYYKEQAEREAEEENND